MTLDRVDNRACMVVAKEFRDNNVIVITWLRLWGYDDNDDRIFQTKYDKRGYTLDYDYHIPATDD